MWLKQFWWHTSVLAVVRQYLQSVKVFPSSPLCSAPHPPSGVWRCAVSWEGTQAGQLTQTDQRDISHHITSCSEIKLRGGVFGEGSHLLRDWLSSFRLQEVASGCLCITCFVFFPSFIRLSLSRLTSFLAFVLSILSTILLQGVLVVVVSELSCQPG